MLISVNLDQELFSELALVNHDRKVEPLSNSGVKSRNRSFSLERNTMSDRTGLEVHTFGLPL
jgi:hypothetical protein